MSFFIVDGYSTHLFPHLFGKILMTVLDTVSYSKDNVTTETSLVSGNVEAQGGVKWIQVGRV